MFDNDRVRRALAASGAVAAPPEEGEEEPPPEPTPEAVWQWRKMYDTVDAVITEEGHLDRQLAALGLLATSLTRLYGWTDRDFLHI